MPDRRTGKNSSYTVPDAASGAFSVFFTQEPSFLAYMNTIPSDTQIRRLLDEVPAKILNGVFWDSLDYLKRDGLKTMAKSYPK